MLMLKHLCYNPQKGWWMMETIKGYKIVTASDTQQLEKNVTEALEQGWMPQGGVCIDDGLFQAMVQPYSDQEIMQMYLNRLRANRADTTPKFQMD
jgi:hypothetical protein